MYKDLLDGFMKWEIQDKFIKGFYAYKPTGKKIDNTWFEKAWNQMLQFFSLDRESDITEQRDKMYARFLSLYKQNLENNNLKEARLTLDSLNKLLGLNQDNIKMQINDQVVIDFKMDEDTDKELPTD